jgi:hypothetical protein
MLEPAHLPVLCFSENYSGIDDDNNSKRKLV